MGLAQVCTANPRCHRRNSPDHVLEGNGFGSLQIIVRIVFIGPKLSRLSKNGAAGRKPTVT
jgi:hypothetical protein